MFCCINTVDRFLFQANIQGEETKQKQDFLRQINLICKFRGTKPITIVGIRVQIAPSLSFLNFL